jgi:hypothetical protein
MFFYLSISQGKKKTSRFQGEKKDDTRLFHYKIFFDLAWFFGSFQRSGSFYHVTYEEKIRP